MQVFTPRSGLTGAANEAAVIMMSFPDGFVYPPTAMLAAWTVLSVSDAMVIPKVIPYLQSSTMVLQTNWRADNPTQTVSYEANRRITTTFPEYSQRNSNSEINGYITTYGADTTTWPAAEQARKAEVDRCWNYVNAVRNIANAMVLSALPVDPTDDSHWPTVISPYVPLS
jgi:hypothetical protein